MPTDDTHDYPPPMLEADHEAYIPRMKSHYSYGMTGVGRCSMCSNVRTLYVHSYIHTQESHVATDPMCHSCVHNWLSLEHTERRDYLIGENVSWESANTDFLMRLLHQLCIEWLDVPQHTREEVLEHPQGCRACCRFFMLDEADEPNERLRPIQAYALHFGTILTRSIGLEPNLVHRNCAIECQICGRYRYSPYGRPNIANMIHVFMIDDERLRVCHECRSLPQYDDYASCSSCSDFYERGEMYPHWNELFCASCHDRVYDCEACGDEYFENDGHDCSDRYGDPRSETIHSWDFQPRGGFTFHGDDPHGLYMGFELEIEAFHLSEQEYDDCAEFAAAQLTRENRGFLKHDGSLNYGFEIVTQPHTLDEYMRKFPFEFIRELRDTGFRSWNTDTCGFHVHVSRRAFGWDNTLRKQSGKTEAHMLRFTKLIYDNQQYVRRLAGRSSSQWASFTDAGNLVRKIRNGYQDNGRYSAVNTANSNTLEVRVFRGTLRIERIKAYLEFVHSAVEYTRDLSVSPNNNTLVWARYRKWLQQEQYEKYPNLIQLLNNLPRTRSAESE